MVVLGNLLKKYPDGWYSTAFLSQIEPVIATTYHDWKESGASDEEFWNAFVKTDLIFCLWAPTHIQNLYLERDFPDIAGEGMKRDTQ